MKKYLIVAAVLLLVSGGLWLATKAQAQIPGRDTGYGHLFYYHNMVACSGTTYADAGHLMEWRKDSEQTWHDGVRTDDNGYFTQTLHLSPWTGRVYIRAKQTCDEEGHMHTPCTESSWGYADNPGTAECGTIYSKECTPTK